MKQISNVNDLVTRLTGIGNVVIYLLVALAVIYIVWAVVHFLVKGSEGDENRHKAIMQIVWGIVGLVIILSIWGLVGILVNTFSTNINAPTDRFPKADFVNPQGTTQGSNINAPRYPGGAPCEPTPGSPCP